MIMASEAREQLNKGTMIAHFKEEGDKKVKASLKRNFNYADVNISDAPSGMSKKAVAEEAKKYYEALGYDVYIDSKYETATLYW